MRACKAAELSDYVCALTPAAIFMVAPIAEPAVLGLKNEPARLHVLVAA
jgi:hypothetical protein